MHPEQLMPWPAINGGIPAGDVLAFCTRHRIAPELATALSLVRKHFASDGRVDVHLDSDPEESGEWVVIEVGARNGVDDFLAAYDRCISEWAKEIPAPALGLIRLSYHLL